MAFVSLAIGRRLNACDQLPSALEIAQGPTGTCPLLDQSQKIVR
jgi:hypothetical protein